MIRNINVLEISYVSEVMSEGFVIIVTTRVSRLIESRIGDNATLLGGNILVSFEELTMQFNGKTNKVGGHKKEITESE